jgi:hypothetical protein
MKKIIFVLVAFMSGTVLSAQESSSYIEFGVKGIFQDSAQINAHTSNSLAYLVPATYHGIVYGSRIADFDFVDLYMGAKVYGCIENNSQSEFYSSTLGGFFNELQIKPLDFLEIRGGLACYCGVSNLYNSSGEYFISGIVALEPEVKASLLVWGFRLSGTASWVLPVLPVSAPWMQPQAFSFGIFLGKDF